MSANATELKEKLNIDTEVKELSMASKAAQALSNPVNMTEYLGDKVIAGVITTACFFAIKGAASKVKEARDLKREVSPHK